MSWATPYSGGAATITSYTATATPGGATCTASPPSANTCTIHGPGTGLAIGTTYQVTVKDTATATPVTPTSTHLNSPASAAVSATPSNAQNCSYYTGPYANLQGCNLTSYTLNGDLTGANLAGTNLTGAYLNDVTLTNANLSGTVLTNATVVNVSSGGITASSAPTLPSRWGLTQGYLLGPQANLKGASLATMAPAAGVSLSGANLAGANLAGANLTSTNLSSATLTGATLSGAILSSANLAGVTSGSITPSLATPSPVLPSGWTLLGGYLIGAGANLDGANLAGLNLSTLTLSGTNLNYANLSSANLTGATLTNATLLQANLTNTNLTNANLQGVSSGSITTQPSVLPSGWHLIGDYLVGAGADLNGANLSGASFSGVDLSGANLTDATLTGASFTDSTLTNATLTGVASGSVTADTTTTATFPAITTASNTYHWELAGGYLIGTGANLAGANLAGANLAGDYLGGAADLQGANLSGAILGTTTAGDDLGGANLTDVDLAGATVSHVNLSGALVSGGTLGPLVGTPNTFPTPTGWTDVNNYLLGPLAPTISSAGSTSFTAGAADSFTVTTTGRPTPTIAETGTLPAGVTFVDNTTTGSASLSGTPATGTAGTYPLTLSAISAAGGAVQSFSLTVTGSTVTGSAPQLVQTASATETTALSSLQATFPSPTTTGDLLVLSASQYTGATNHVTSVTDSAGNTWRPIGDDNSSGHNSDGEMWYSSGAASATTVTVHNTAAASVAFEVQEFSSGTTSPLVLDSSAGTSTTGTAANSGAITASAPGELAVGFVAGHANAEAITVPATPFTAQPQLTTTGSIATLITGDEVVGGSGSPSFSGSFKTAMYWAAAVATFKPSSTPAPAVAPTTTVPASTASSSSPVGITPSASGFVDSTNLATNFSGASALVVSSSEYRTYLKFDTTHIPQGAKIDSATLTVTPSTAPIGSGAGTIQLHLPATAPGAQPDAWSQETLSSNTQPPWNPAVIDPTGSATAVAGVPQQFNVTGAITEGGNTNFALDFSSATPAFLDGASAGSNAPVLSVTYTTTLYASAGTFDSSAAAAQNTGYDGVNPLSFSLSSYQTYLTFPTAALGSGVSLQSASLTVTPTTASAAGAVTVFALGGPGTTGAFNASTLDYNTAPKDVSSTPAGTGTPLCSPTCTPNMIPLSAPALGFTPGSDLNVALGVAVGGTLDKISNQAQGTAAPFVQLTVQLVPSPPVPAHTANSLCGSAQNQTAPTSKVMIVWEENKSWLDQGSPASAPALSGDTQDAPYINSLATQCAVVSNGQLGGEAGYQSDSHGSLGNYLAVATGDLSTYEGDPWDDDCPADQAAQPSTKVLENCATGQASIFSQGASWKGYAESMDSACENRDGGGTPYPSGLTTDNAYLNRHNPPVYFSNLANCLTNDVPFPADDAEQGNPLYNDVMSGNLPTISSVTPNSLDDGHYSPGPSEPLPAPNPPNPAAQTGADNNLENQDTDSWLQTWLPIITSGPDYQSGDLTILVVWDEGYGGNVKGNNTPSDPPLFVISPYVTPGATDSSGTDYSAASITRTVQEIAGEQPLLSSDSNPPDLLKSWLGP